MNYIGSKYSLLEFLQSGISEFTGLKDDAGYVFADLFAGTGVVGSTYKKKGCYVISNDIQYYSYVLNRHYISNCPPVDDSLLDHLNSLEGIDGFIFNNYCAGSGSGRNYFKDENGRRCDAIRTELERLYKNKEISDSIYFYFLASLISSIDKYANTASVYGAFLKEIKKSAQRDFSLELLPVIEGRVGEVYNENINYLVKRVGGDVLYLDPPYNARQFCTNYHVLETIARYDDPILIGKTGLREYSAQKSEFCSKRTVASAFRDLLKNAKFKYIFLSYNAEGLMGIEEIKDIMSSFGSYYCFAQEHKRFKADSEERRRISANSTIEYLHCLKKEV